MADLSPAARAVYDKITEVCPCPADHVAVAALRAATSVLRDAYVNEEYVDSADNFLDDIATELENNYVKFRT
jgi:hypothetical protein